MELGRQFREDCTMQRASPAPVDHEVPPGAALRSLHPSSLPLSSPKPVFSTVKVTPLPARHVLLPLSFVLALVAVVGCGSALLAMTVAYLFLAPNPVAQVAVPAVMEAKPTPIEKPRLEPIKDKAAPAL